MSIKHKLPRVRYGQISNADNPDPFLKKSAPKGMFDFRQRGRERERNIDVREKH